MMPVEVAQDREIHILYDTEHLNTCNLLIFYLLYNFQKYRVFLTRCGSL